MPLMQLNFKNGFFNPTEFLFLVPFASRYLKTHQRCKCITESLFVLPIFTGSTDDTPELVGCLCGSLDLSQRTRLVSFQQEQRSLNRNVESVSNKRLKFFPE